MATRRRISKPLLLRIGAVGLFVALGTFAVLHSINKSKQNEPDDPGSADEIAGNSEDSSQSNDAEGNPDQTLVSNESSDSEGAPTPSGIDNNSAGRLLAEPNSTALASQQTTEPSGLQTSNPSTSPLASSSSFEPPGTSASGSIGDNKADNDDITGDVATVANTSIGGPPSAPPTLSIGDSSGGFVPPSTSSSTISDTSSSGGTGRGIPVITASDKTSFPPLRPGTDSNTSESTETTLSDQSVPVLPVPPLVGQSKTPGDDDSFDTNATQQDNESFTSSEFPPLRPGLGSNDKGPPTSPATSQSGTDETTQSSSSSSGSFVPNSSTTTSGPPSFPGNDTSTGNSATSDDGITSRTVQSPLSPLRMNQQSPTPAKPLDNQTGPADSSAFAPTGTGQTSTQDRSTSQTDGAFQIPGSSNSSSAANSAQTGSSAFPPTVPAAKAGNSLGDSTTPNRFNPTSQQTSPPTNSSALNTDRSAIGTIQSTMRGRNTVPDRSTVTDHSTVPDRSTLADRNNPALPTNSTGLISNTTSSAAPTPSANAQATPGERNLEGVQLPSLSLQKIAPREIQVNRPAVFQLIVKNSGRVPASGVIVHDFVPKGTQLIKATPAPTPGQGGQLQWNLGTILPGKNSVIRMELLPLEPGNIGSVANVTFAAQASAQTVCTKPVLAIRHEAPETVLIGHRVMLNIFVENKGNGAAENVLLQEDVPDGLIFAGGQRELEYEIGTLGPGQVRKVQLLLTASKVGTVKNLVVATGEGKLQATDTIEMRIVAPDLSLTGDGPNRKFLNRQAKHTFTVSNRGTAAATNMQMVARLPRGLRFVNANNQGQYDPGAHAVVWRLARLDANRTGQVELTTMPVATGQQNIEVSALADLNQKQTIQQAMEVQQLAELFFDIDDTTDPIEIGASTAYKIKIVNQGAKVASNVRISVEFPPAVKPGRVESNVPHEIRGQTVVIQPIPQIASRQEVSFLIHATALSAGDHRVVVNVQNDDREIAVSKEESTHIYADR